MRYNAVAFLHELCFPDLAPGPEQLPLDLHFEWEERAAIMEYDGGLPRERSEALALATVLKEMEQREAKR